MEKKYYTPSLEDFHTGFEYEVYIPHNEEWSKEVFYLNKSHIAFVKYVDIQDSETVNPVRVKYLDKDDIESFGFGDYIPPHEYDHTWTLNNYVLQVWFNNTIPHIRIKNLHVMIFDGHIKNKSEFKKLLKQLNIL